MSSRTDRFVEEALGGDVTELRRHLSSARLALELPREFGATFTGQAILFTLLNLIVRLDAYCPTITVFAPGGVPRHPLVRLLAEGDLTDSLRAFFADFPPALDGRLVFTPDPIGEFRSEERNDPVAVSVRIAPTSSGGHDLTLWSDGWVAYIGTSAPWRQGTEAINAVGAHVAAGLGAAEVFKRLLPPGAQRTAHAMPGRPLVFSAFDYSLSADGANPPLPEVVDMDGVALVGLGGIGAGFAAAAACLPEIRGTLDLVDRDLLDGEGSNLNRHLISRPGDENVPKAELARRALSFAAGVRARQQWYEEYEAEEGSPPEIAVVGVDKDAVRRAVQGTLPRLILNAGTSDSGGFQVTRHDFQEGACLSCVARGDIDEHAAERNLAAQLGLDLDAIFRYQGSGESVPETELRAGGKLTEEQILRFAGRPLAEIRMGVCAEINLGDGPQREAVSISFLSALPGFLLLGEVIRAKHFPDSLYPQRGDIPGEGHSNHCLMSVLGAPHDMLLRQRREKQPGCDCTRAAYQRAYMRRWGSSGA